MNKLEQTFNSIKRLRSEQDKLDNCAYNEMNSMTFKPKRDVDILCRFLFEEMTGEYFLLIEIEGAQKQLYIDDVKRLIEFLKEFTDEYPVDMLCEALKYACDCYSPKDVKSLDKE
jgi:hypothetical protein